MPTKQSDRGSPLIETLSSQVCLDLWQVDRWNELWSLPLWYLCSTEIQKEIEQWIKWNKWNAKNACKSDKSKYFGWKEAIY